MRQVFHAFPQDVRHSVRGLTTSPGFVAGVLLSLAVGIGANAAAFSFINAVVFRPFEGVSKQHELARITLGAQDPRGFRRFAYYQPGELEMLRRGLTTINGLSALREASLAVLAKGQASAVPGALVSSNYFSVLGVRPVAGRLFNGDEDGVPFEHPVTVISERAWDRLFARDPSIVGQTVSVNGSALQIVGVAPAGFAGAHRGDDAEERAEFWIPLGLAALTLRDANGRPASVDAAHNVVFDYIGRRRVGASMEQVQAEASVLAQQMSTGRDRPLTATASRVWLNDPVESAPAIVGFLAIPMLVLAIACVNAANLLLARSSRQARDWAVRLALGASRWRVLRQVFTESLLLAILSAALGLTVARWALDAAAAAIWIRFPIDYRVAAFTIATTVVTAIAFSLGPALGVLRNASRRIASTAPPPARARFALVAVQAALSLGLLATGAQFTKTVFDANPRIAVIPEPERLLLGTVDLDPMGLEAEAGADFYRRLLDRIRAVPGVRAAGLATAGLMGGLGGDSGARVWVPDSPPAGLGVLAFHASPGFLEAVGAPLLQGRRFTSADEPAVRTVIVNEHFSEKLFKGQAIGRTFRLASPEKGAVQHEVTIVGVVGGMMRRTDLEGPLVYYPAPLRFHPARTLYVRVDAAFDAARLHAAAREVDVRVPIADVATLGDMRARRNPERKLLSTGVGALGLLALVLAAGGLYAVVSYVVSLRRREVGVRMALGAGPRSIVRMIVRQALVPTLIGAAVGAAGAATAGAVIRSSMFGVSKADPLAFGGAAALMGLSMLAASWVPARQAGRVDPVEVLRTE